MFRNKFKITKKMFNRTFSDYKIFTDDNILLKPKYKEIIVNCEKRNMLMINYDNYCVNTKIKSPNCYILYQHTFDYKYINENLEYCDVVNDIDFYYDFNKLVNDKFKEYDSKFTHNKKITDIKLKQYLKKEELYYRLGNYELNVHQYPYFINVMTHVTLKNK